MLMKRILNVFTKQKAKHMKENLNFYYHINYLNWWKWDKILDINNETVLLIINAEDDEKDFKKLCSLKDKDGNRILDYKKCPYTYYFKCRNMERIVVTKYKDGVDMKYIGPRDDNYLSEQEAREQGRKIILRELHNYIEDHLEDSEDIIDKEENL